MRFKDFPMSLCFLPTSHTQKACIKSRAVQAKGGGMYGGPRNMYQVYKFPPWYCCKHMKCLSFYSLSRSGWVFLKDMSHGECCWRHDFWASRFQNYLWEDTPRPQFKLAPSALVFKPHWVENTLRRLWSFLMGEAAPFQVALDINSTISVSASLLIQFVLDVAIVSVWCTYWSKCWIELIFRTTPCVHPCIKTTFCPVRTVWHSSIFQQLCLHNWSVYFLYQRPLVVILFPRDKTY